MQSIAALLVGCTLVFAARPANAQEAAGTTLWRVAATTLAVPPALARGPGAILWNPAQSDDSAPQRTQLALEAVQTPAAISASGMLAAITFPAGAAGRWGLVYGRVGMSDLGRTTDAPDPDGIDIPVYTYAIGGTMSRQIRGTTVGATLAFHETRLDQVHGNRWTLDVGASRKLAGDRVRVAAATHFFSSFSTTDPAQDIYTGVEARVWQGPLWGDRATLLARYGLSFAHGFGADHHIGIGAEFARIVAVDFAVAREGAYAAEAGWRPVGAVQLTVGKYRVLLARDAGVNELGSAYRVGVDARF
jgi:hypothetical protein